MTIGEEVKRRRKALKLTQYELGERIGLDASAVSKIERGSTQNLKPKQLEQLCQLFGCTPSDLYGLETFTYSSSTLLTTEQQTLITMIPLLTADEAATLLRVAKAMFNIKEGKNAGL